MAITVFEGYTVGPVERGIALTRTREKPLSIEQTALSQLKTDDIFDVKLEVGGLSRRDVSRLRAWARQKGIFTIQTDIESRGIRIQRIQEPPGGHGLP